jgi:hypothetical protein
MPVRIPVPASGQPRNSWNRPEFAVAAVTIIGLVAVVASIKIVPAALVLPALSVALLFAAGLIALVAWFNPQAHSGGRLTYWDIAGALTLISIFAALLSDPEQVLPLLEAKHSE